MSIEEILKSENVTDAIKNNIDYILDFIPEIRFMIGFDHKHPHHHLDVYKHTLYALSLSENDFEIRLCLLLHDIGKPFSYQEGEVRNFKNHALASSILAKEILKRLNYDNQFIEEVCYLIRYHDTPIKKSDIDSNYELALKRYKIQECDALAHHPDKLEKRIKYLKKVNSLLKN